MDNPLLVMLVCGLGAVVIVIVAMLVSSKWQRRKSRKRYLRTRGDYE
jgi:hypothetical protein